MARSDLWTRDQLLMALRLYMRLPFGRLHRLNPEIIQLASQIGRTPNAMAMKACNFANLDPALQARGIRGLRNIGNADRKIWQEFAANPESLAAEAEDAAVRISGQENVQVEGLPELRIPGGETEVERVIRARRVQSFFRAAVLTTYESKCALSDIRSPELLTASHIIPWSVSVERRADPRNGLCLNALFDRAFDRGLISLDDDMRVLVSKKLSSEIAEVRLKCSLDAIAGAALRVPRRFPPDPVAIRYHREHVLLR